jgi:hypothetical protein
VREKDVEAATALLNRSRADGSDVENVDE